MAGARLDVHESILRGDYSSLPPENTNVVRIFLSSTFGDFIQERNKLTKEIFPFLQSYCQQRGLEFQVVDMRWGVRDENISYHQTSDVCIQEIVNCQRLSIGPSFVAFLGNRYGYRPFPAQIPTSEFTLLLSIASSHDIDTSLLVKWYQNDDNSVPPVFQLRPINQIYPNYVSKDEKLRETDRQKWWDTFLKLQSLFWRLVDVAVGEGSMSVERRHQYVQSVTEDEIHHGILAVPSPNSHCLCYTRKLVGIHDNLTDSMATKHIDVDPHDPTRVNLNAQEHLQNLKEEKLPRVLYTSNIHQYSIPWVPGGVDPSVLQHEAYLKEFCSQVCADIKRLIDEALLARDESTSALFQEVLHHATFCIRKCDSFCGRANILNHIEQHITSSNSSSNRPLIVHGPSGSGKTSVMAKAALNIHEWMKGRGSLAMVLRFLGTSPSSSSIRSVLESVCTQICTTFQLPLPKFQQMDYIQVVQYFQGQLLESLSLAEKHGHLVIFLDSIDQLSSSNGAYTLNWLPKILPSNVHVVVSMLPQEHGCLQTIQSMLPYKECYVEVDAMPLQTGMDILESWLGKIGRKLTHEQEGIVGTAFSMHPQPLFLRLLFRTVRFWKSYTPIDKMIVAKSTTEALAHFYEYLEENYGRILVQRALGYITAAGNGLTEAELEDVLSLDDEVLNDVYQYWDPPVEGVVRIPVLLWKRIRHIIDDYLVQQHADGKTVLVWYHRQFVESARARYVEKDEHTKETLHLILSTFFEGTWCGDKGKTVTLSHRQLTIKDAKRQVASQPLLFSNNVYNLRKLNELPLHLLLSKQQEKLKQITLCNFEWLHTKLKATDFSSLMSDFSLALTIVTEDKDVSVTNETLLLSGHSLKINPDSLAGQLLGRLNSLKSFSSSHIQILLSQVHKWIEAYDKSLLIPNNTCLISPGGPLKTTLSGHPQLVLGLTISNTHPFAVSCSKGSNSSIFNIWNVKSFQYIQNLHTLKITDSGSPCFALKGELLTAVSGKTLCIWNCKTGEEFSSTSLTDGIFTALSVKSDNQLIVAGTKTGAIVTCAKHSVNFETITEVQNNSCIKHIEFADGDSLCVFATDSGELGVIDITTKNLIHMITLHSSSITCLHTTTIQSNTPALVFTGSEDKTAKVVNLKTGKVQHTLVGHTKTVKCLTTLPNSSKFLVTGSLDKMLKVWDTQSGQCIQTMKGHLDGVWCVAAMADGQRVISGSKDDYLKVWDIKTGCCLHTLEGHSSWVSCVAVTSESIDIVLSASNDKTVKVWMLAKETAPSTDRHYMQPECIASTKTGLVISGAPDATKVWNVSDGSCVHTFDSPSSSLALTIDDKCLISGAKNGMIRVWDLLSFTLVSTLEGHKETVTAILVLDVNTILSASMDSTMNIWNVHSGECVTLNGHSSGIKCVTVSKKKDVAISGSFDCSVRVWDTKNKTCSSILKGHSKVVWCVAINSTDTEVVSGGDDSNIILWSLGEGSALLRIECTDNVKCVAFSPDDKFFIAGTHCGKNQLKAYDKVTGECVTDYIGHTHAVMVMLVINEQCIVTGSRDGHVRIWNIVSGETLASFDLQSQVKYLSLAKVCENEVTLAATTKSGPIAILRCNLSLSIQQS